MSQSPREVIAAAVAAAVYKRVFGKPILPPAIPRYAESCTDVVDHVIDALTAAGIKLCPPSHVCVPKEPSPRDIIAAVLAGTHGQLATKWADEIIAALDAAGIKLCPPGYVCVPEEPSEKMIDAALNHARLDSTYETPQVYRAMLQAARSEQAEDKP